MKFYRQVTDPSYPGAAIGADSATTNKRVKVVHTQNQAVADEFYNTFIHIEEDGQLPEVMNAYMPKGETIAYTKQINRMKPCGVVLSVHFFDAPFCGSSDGSQDML